MKITKENKDNREFVENTAELSEDYDPEIEKLFDDYFNGIMDDNDTESFEKMAEYCDRGGYRPIEELFKKYGVEYE